MSDAQLHAWKAYALLLPTPFDWIDPAGEPARQAELRGWLEGVGLDLGGVDRERLEQCATEAHDALIVRTQPPDATGVPPLRHPLSAELLPRSGRKLDPQAQHADLLAALQEVNGPPDGRWYRRLWRKLMRWRSLDSA